MILRSSDWGRYPDAIADDTTHNESFLNFTDLLGKMNIENRYCQLALHNPVLKGINPRSNEVKESVILQNLILDECAINPWYWFREIIRVPSDGNDGSPFMINRGNFAMYWSFFNNIDAGVEFLRQHGKTTAIVGLGSYLIRFLWKSRTILITKDPKLREETITKFKEIRSMVPSWLWPITQDDPDNKEAFACMARGNKLITAIGQNDEMSANGVGRGLTAGRLLNDEGPFTRNIHHILPAALASGAKARQINERDGTPYGNVFCTTPGDLDVDEGKYIYELLTSGINWDERFLDIGSRAELLKIIAKGATSEKPRDIFYIKFNHLQLGTTDEELYQMIRNTPATPEKLRKDYGGEWSSGGLHKPYSAQDADRMKKSRKQALYKEITPEGYIIDWYYPQWQIKQKMSDYKHVIGIDPSEAVGRDAIALVLTNADDGEVAAVVRVKESNVTRYAQWLAAFMIKWVNTVLIMERKNSGAFLLDALLEILSGKVDGLHRRIYSKIGQEISPATDLYQKWKVGPQGQSIVYWGYYRKYLGFATDRNKRETLYSTVFSNSLQMCAEKMNSEYLIDEVMALVEKNGRIDHISSGHDDTVIAWLLTMWLITLGKNLDFYGINPRHLTLSKSAEAMGVSEDEYLEIKDRQAQLIDTLESETKLLAVTDCPIERARLTAHIRYISTQLDTGIDSANTMQALRELVQRERII